MSNFSINFLTFDNSTFITCTCKPFIKLSNYTECTTHLRIHFVDADSRAHCALCPTFSCKTWNALKNHIKKFHQTHANLVLSRRSLTNRRMINELNSLDKSLTADRNDNVEESIMEVQQQNPDDLDDYSIDADLQTNSNLPNQMEDQLMQEFAKQIALKKLKFGTPHNAASETFIAGFKFAVELSRQSRLSQFNIDQLTKFSGNVNKQIETILKFCKRQFNTDSELLHGETVKWYHFKMRDTILDLLLDDDGFLLDEMVKENERLVIPGVYQGYKDGKLYAEEQETNPLIIECRCELYIDDFRKNKQEATEKTNLTGVFIVINNVPFYLQSGKEDISMVMIGTNHIFKLVKKKRFMKVLTDELIELKNNPIQLTSGRYAGRYIRISIVCFDGDNKAMNEMMDISENFSSPKSQCCRGCPADNEIMQTLNQFDLPIRPLPSSHILNNIVKHSMCYAFDFFHDMVGNIKTVMKYLIFKHYPTPGAITSLNSSKNRTHFENGKIEINAKTKNFKSTSGAQLIEFFIKFSFIDWMCVDQDDYIIYLKLRSIYNAFSKFELTDQEMDKADQDVQSLISKLIELKIKVKPKMHNLVHYKVFTQRYGPVFKYSTLRFERKNQDLLKKVKTSLNDKDVPLSVTRWYMVDKSIKEKDCSNTNFVETFCEDKAFEYFIELDQPVKEYREYRLKKVTFKINKFLILNEQLNSQVLNIGKVTKIFEQSGMLKLICLKFKTSQLVESKMWYHLECEQELVELDVEKKNLFYIHLHVIDNLETMILFKTF